MTMLQKIREISGVDYISLNQIENRHKGHWFSMESMRFFGTRLADDAHYIEGSNVAYFVSSEQNDIFRTGPRKFTIRAVSMPDCSDIRTIGDFCEMKTSNTAYRKIYNLLVKEQNQ